MTGYEYQGHPALSLPHDLSEREIQILALIAHDRTDKEVARSLGLSVSTVHSHMKAVRRKLHVHTRVGAIVKALAERIIILQTSDTHTIAVTPCLDARAGGHQLTSSMGCDSITR